MANRRSTLIAYVLCILLDIGLALGLVALFQYLPRVPVGITARDSLTDTVLKSSILALAAAAFLLVSRHLHHALAAAFLELVRVLELFLLLALLPSLDLILDLLHPVYFSVWDPLYLASLYVQYLSLLFYPVLLVASVSRDRAGRPNAGGSTAGLVIASIGLLHFSLVQLIILYDAYVSTVMSAASAPLP